MQDQIYILVIEDELEVMDALVNDLEEFENFFPVETANSSEEAKQVIDDIHKNKSQVGLILCDHVLPGQNGVELLVELQQQEELKATRKVLVTGQAGLEETIIAVNKADLNHYIAKPWTKSQLDQVVKDELTQFVIDQHINPLRYMVVLNADELSDYIRDHPLTDH